MLNAQWLKETMREFAKTYAAETNNYTFQAIASTARLEQAIACAMAVDYNKTATDGDARTSSEFDEAAAREVVIFAKGGESAWVDLVLSGAF